MVEEAARYIMQGGFTVPASSADAMDQWVNNDAALAWLSDRLVILEEQRLQVVVANDDNPGKREPILIKEM